MVRRQRIDLSSKENELSREKDGDELDGEEREERKVRRKRCRLPVRRIWGG
jgi:hypothetical protein